MSAPRRQPAAVCSARAARTQRSASSATPAMSMTRRIRPSRAHLDRDVIAQIDELKTGLQFVIAVGSPAEICKNRLSLAGAGHGRAALTGALPMIDDDAHPHSFAAQHQVRGQQIARRPACSDRSRSLHPSCVQLRCAILSVARQLERRLPDRVPPAARSASCRAATRIPDAPAAAPARRRSAARRSRTGLGGVRLSTSAPTPNGPDR